MGIILLALSLFFLSFSLLLFFVLSGFHGVKLLDHCGTGIFSGWLSASGLLAVRLPCSRPKVGGLVGWLSARRLLAVRLSCSRPKVGGLVGWLFAPVGLLYS